MEVLKGQHIRKTTKCGKYKSESPKRLCDKVCMFSITKFSWYPEPPVAFPWLETYLITPGKLGQMCSFINHFFLQIQASSVLFVCLFVLLSPALGAFGMSQQFSSGGGVSGQQLGAFSPMLYYTEIELFAIV